MDRDVTEATDRIQRKDVELTTDELGGDLAAVMALRKKHAAIETDLEVLGSKVIAKHWVSLDTDIKLSTSWMKLTSYCPAPIMHVLYHSVVTMIICRGCFDTYSLKIFYHHLKCVYMY